MDTMPSSPRLRLFSRRRPRKRCEKTRCPWWFAGVEHRPEHCTWLFWKLTQVFALAYYGTSPPLVNAGVILGTAGILQRLCTEMIEQARASGEKDDQRILNQLVAHDARRNVDTLIIDRGTPQSVILHKLHGFHSHCDRSLFGPLRHLFSNVPHVPCGPLNYEINSGGFEEWLQTGSEPLKVRNAHGESDLVYVCHGIFSTHLGPICDALGIERPPPADLAKRKISQADLRLFVETSRQMFRGGIAILVAWLAGSAGRECVSACCSQNVLNLSCYCYSHATLLALHSAQRSRHYALVLPLASSVLSSMENAGGCASSGNSSAMGQPVWRTGRRGAGGAVGEPAGAAFVGVAGIF